MNFKNKAQQLDSACCEVKIFFISVFVDYEYNFDMLLPDERYFSKEY